MVTRPIQIRELRIQDIPACETMLDSLPHWFGMEASNRAYLESLRTLPGAVVTVADQIKQADLTPTQVRVLRRLVEEEFK